MTERIDRRGFLNKTALGAAGVGAAYGLEEKILLAATENGSGQSAKTRPKIAPGSMPCGKIGKVTVSRLLLGGNLIGVVLNNLNVTRDYYYYYHSYYYYAYREPRKRRAEPAAPPAAGRPKATS